MTPEIYGIVGGGLVVLGLIALAVYLTNLSSASQLNDEYAHAIALLHRSRFEFGKNLKDDIESFLKGDVHGKEVENVHGVRAVYRSVRR